MDFERMPTLQSQFQQKQYATVIGGMLRADTSALWLAEYGAVTADPHEKQLKHYLQSYSIKEVFFIKGSRPKHPNYFENVFLQKFVLHKLQSGVLLTQEERRLLWLELTEIRQCPQLYVSLKNLQLPPSILKQIQKDVIRTTPEQTMYLNVSNEQIQTFRGKLKNVLEAVAKYNPYLGYCQGMNCVVGFFLNEGFNEQECFFLMKRATECLLPCDFYVSLKGMLTYVKVLYEALSLTHPQLNLRILEIILTQFDEGKQNRFTLAIPSTFNWLLSLFTATSLPRSIRLLILDHFFLQGAPALIKATFACFDFLQPYILDVHSFDQYMKIMDTYLKDFDCPKLFLNRMNSRFICKRMLELVGERLMTVLPTETNNWKSQQVQCNSNWVGCMKVQEEMRKKAAPQFFVAKLQEPIQIKSDYIDSVKMKYFFQVPLNKKKQKKDQQLLGKMVHTCQDSCSTEATLPDEESRSESLKQPNAIRKHLIAHLQQNIPHLQQGMRHSHSVQFLLEMYQNQSISHLLNILDKQELQKIQQNDQTSERSTASFKNSPIKLKDKMFTNDQSD